MVGLSKKTVTISLLATIFSILVSYIIESRGIVHEGDGGDFRYENSEEIILTQDELIRQSQLVRERIDRRFEELINERRGPFFEETKKISILFSWVPWFFIGALANLRRSEKLVVLIFPLIFIFGNVFSILEFLAFIAAMYAGSVLHRWYSVRKQPKH